MSDNRYKMLTEMDILRAMKYTRSNRQAAKFLGVNLETYKKYASIYCDEEGTPLYQVHMNSSGKGIRKQITEQEARQELDDILDGKYPDYPLFKLKRRLIMEGLIYEKCDICGFEERRITDGVVPLMMTFKDGNKEDWSLNNLELVCLNCYFLYHGNIFGRRETKEMF